MPAALGQWSAAPYGSPDRPTGSRLPALGTHTATTTAENAGSNVCLACGYDLAGLAIDTICPECAFPVARSRERSPLLRTADPAWLASILRGLTDQTRAIRILLYTVLVGIGLALLGWQGAGWGRAAGGVAANGLMLIGLTAVAVMHGRACVRLSAATHGGFAAPASDRVMLLAFGLLLPVCAGCTLVLASAFSALPWTAIRIGHAVCQIIALGYLFALAAVLRGFEIRTPGWGPALRQRHRNVRKNILGLLIIILLVFWISPAWRGAGLVGRDWGVAFFGLAYVFMGIPVSRVRSAAALEAAIAAAGPAATIPTPSRSRHP